MNAKPAPVFGSAHPTDRRDRSARNPVGGQGSRCRGRRGETTSRLTTRFEDLPASVRITRSRHPLQDRSLRVLGGMRRHGLMELLLELPDGSKSLIPAAWTDAEQVAGEGDAGAATLGSLADLLHVCELIADL